MKNKIISMLLLSSVCLSAHATSTVVLPETTKSIKLSSENPNRIHCTDGNVNDMAFPDDYPLTARAKNQNLYISYKKLLQPDGEVETVSDSHTLHVVCDGQVYTMVVNPIKGQGRTIRLGDPTAKQLKNNAQIMREKSEDEIISDLIYAAYHNDLPPNYTVSPSNKKMSSVIAGITFDEVRKISLNGLGLSLKEYVVTGAPGSLVPHQMIIEQGKHFSKTLRGVSIKPERLPANGKARLFILETKI
jgi:hypothetical protein